MKVIEQGLRVTSRYFGDGYVVRTIQDTTTKVRYVAIRKDADNGVLLCVFPHSVNYLFDLPFEFSQSPTTKAYLMNIDDLSAPYCANHKYIRVELAWPKRVGLRPPGVGTKLPHTPDTISAKEAALSLATKVIDRPSSSYVHSANDILDDSSVIYGSAADDVYGDLSIKRTGLRPIEKHTDFSAFVDYNIEDI